MSDTTCNQESLSLGGVQFTATRPHEFGLVVHASETDSEDYLHEILLAPENRDDFYSLIETEGLVVCKNVRTQAPTYRKVRGKSSQGKLSQAEYYHHDGCSCPTKPRVVEIRLPYQDIERGVATAIAPFSAVIKAMLVSLPDTIHATEEILELKRLVVEQSSNEAWHLPPNFPTVETWDKIQGRITRIVRRELDAESCRAFFRAVDKAANAYDKPWEFGESRLMLNNHDDLTRTMQHRRAYQKPRAEEEQNGSLVKRWTAEEV